MAPEPLHLAGIVKSCRRCRNNDVKYMYNNNSKSDQPRYKCLNKECRIFFTFGGKCRGPYAGKRLGVPVEQLFSNRIGVVAGDGSTCIAKLGVMGNRSVRIAKPNPGALLQGVRIGLRDFPKSKPFEVEKILDEDHVGVVGSAAIGAVRFCLSNASSVNSNCLSSSASSAKSKLLQELPKRCKGSVVGDARSSTGTINFEQRKASKKVHEGAESKIEWVKAGTAPYGLVPAVKSKQLKRIRVQHQEREFIIENFT